MLAWACRAYAGWSDLKIHWHKASLKSASDQVAHHTFVLMVSTKGTSSLAESSQPTFSQRPLIETHRNSLQHRRWQHMTESIPAATVTGDAAPA